MKRIWMAGICIMLLVLQTMPAWAEGNMSGDDILVADHTCDKPFERNGEKVYSISAQKRETDGAFEPTKDRKITLKSVTTDMHGIIAEMKTEIGKKDITVKVVNVSEDGKEAQISINFSSRRVVTNLNMDDAIIIKKDGQILKSILFAYSTPYFQDEHYEGFNSLEPWSGTWEFEDGISFKSSGMIDVYQKSPVLTYTYKAEGRQGVKAFHLNPEGNFTFADGSTANTSISHKLKAVNNIQLKCKDSYVSTLKTKLLQELSYDEDAWELKVFFDDVLVEYEDGCYIGGMNDPIYLGYTATLKPLRKITLKIDKKTGSSIKLQWDQAESVSGYCIYRAEKKDSGYKKINTVSANILSYTDKNLKSGKSYYYKVRPYRDIRYKSSAGQSKMRKLYGSYSNVNQVKRQIDSEMVSVKTTQKKKTVESTNKKRNSTTKSSSPQMGDKTLQNFWILFGLSGMIAAEIIYKKMK